MDERNGDDGRPNQPPLRQEKAASSINVKDFKSDVDDFEEWVELFEKAVKLATNVRDEPTLHYLFKEWLPLKLDNAAHALLKQATKVQWPALKDELIGLLVDPQEKYKWQAKLTTIKWDGKESFHTLAARVIVAVNKYDKEMPDEFKKREYYFRFRAAFKKPMRRFIDMGCPADTRNIEAAKEVALRYQLTTVDDDGDGDEKDALKSVAFASANLHADRATGLETALAGITTQLENLSVTMRTYDERLASLEADRRGASGSQGGYRGRDSSRGSYGYRSDSRGGYQAPRNNGYGRQDRQYGGRDDSRGRQQDRSGDRGRYRDNRGDSRGSYRNQSRDYSGNRNDWRPNGQSGRRDYGQDGRRDNGQDRRRDDRRDGRGDDRRDDRRGVRQDGRRDARQDERRDDRQDGQRDNRRDRRDNSRGRDAYRAIDTGDEASSDESVVDAEARAANGHERREN